MTYGNYLIRKTPTSSFYFRIKIPIDLKDFFDGRNELKISLRNGIKNESVIYTKILSRGTEKGGKYILVAQTQYTCKSCVT